MYVHDLVVYTVHIPMESHMLCVIQSQTFFHAYRNANIHSNKATYKNIWPSFLASATEEGTRINMRRQKHTKHIRHHPYSISPTERHSHFAWLNLIYLGLYYMYVNWHHSLYDGKHKQHVGCWLLGVRH